MTHRHPPVVDYRARVEHVDTDAAGIVHFSRYTSLMETAGLEFLESRGAGLSAFLEDGAQLVVTRLRVSYAHSAAYRDLIVGHACVEHVGGASFRIGVTLSREEADGSRTPLASGTLTFAAVDTGSRRAIPLPSAGRLALKGIATDAG
ncbi:thioesterase family protein [Streptomyces sp. CB03238]|uniref:acyl-CoA thioesterase n=1 Tax=Streptomyces sp. CB03238 TaxID=1907777 RepID=UPI000A1073E8|nr:thioesterase family protein [Streptomyces sp. CB03238]ORT56737.1 hypothetical protein BKD26_26530 [Streptomyces sp. CB03238]